MCGGDANFYSNRVGLVGTFGYIPFNYGGVTLNKTLTLLNDVDKIRGATYDPVRGEVVFVGEGTSPSMNRSTWTIWWWRCSRSF